MLITAQDIKTNTSMGGNVDPDKFMHLVYDAEVLILEPSLGTALYNKIVADFEADTLAGDYLILYTSYIKPVLWHSVYASYLKEGIVLAQNTGIYENAPDNVSGANIDNIDYVAKSAQAKADIYLDRMERYLCDVNIAEYNNSQVNDYDINPREVETLSGWYLPRTNSSDEKYLYGYPIKSYLK